MSFASASINLTHHFLIAIPGLEDAAFARSVVYLCEHSERGALGLIINKPTDITLKGLFDKVDLSLRREDLGREPVFQGGPVQTERGFVLHEPLPDEGRSATDGSAYASTMVIPGGLAMTTSKDVLEALSTGAGPRRVLITLGYSSWGGGQLESELAENAWLTVAADLSVIFDTPAPERYAGALSLLGREVGMLSPSGGHACPACPPSPPFRLPLRPPFLLPHLSVHSPLRPSRRMCAPFWLSTLASSAGARGAQRRGRGQPEALVIGAPLPPDGASHENTALALRFGRQLRGRFGLPVFEVDERYSTTEAIAGGAKDADAAAACIILEQFLRSLG